MTQLATSTDLLASQWQNSPRLIATVDAPIQAVQEEFIDELDALEVQRDIDTATGVWLDYLGTRVGLKRPSVPGRSTVRYGFEGSDTGVGWDRAPFDGSSTPGDLQPLPDEIFRRFIKARGRLVLGNGNFPDFFAACQIIDPASQIFDNRDMTVSIRTTRQAQFELADSIGALQRSAGVMIIYSEPGRFGFEDAGETWDSAPFQGASG